MGQHVALAAPGLCTDSGERQNRAWKAAVQARMAINCAQMEDDQDALDGEPERQYRIAEAYLG